MIQYLGLLVVSWGSMSNDSNYPFLQLPNDRLTDRNTIEMSKLSNSELSRSRFSLRLGVTFRQAYSKELGLQFIHILRYTNVP